MNGRNNNVSTNTCLIIMIYISLCICNTPNNLVFIDIDSNIFEHYLLLISNYTRVIYLYVSVKLTLFLIFLEISTISTR